MTVEQFQELKAIIVPNSAPCNMVPGICVYEYQPYGMVFKAETDNRYIGACVDGIFYYAKGAKKKVTNLMLTYSMMYNMNFGLGPIL